MHDLSRTVSSNEILKQIEDLFPQGTYLVGGCIRDMLLGRVPLDFDLVTYAPVADLAGRIAGRLGARPFWMDERRGVIRIALKSSGASIDISEPKGLSIEEDLRSRDLTINAMAYDIAHRRFIDPLGGFHDLSCGTIRIVSEENLLNDPLRGLRAVRFSVTLDFAMHEETSRMIKQHARRLKGVSGERIRQEILQALRTVHGADFLRLLTWNALVPVLFAPYFPEQDHGGDHQHALLLSVIPACQELDGIIYACDALMPGCLSSLTEETESRVQRGALLRLASFLLGLEGLRSGHLQSRESEISARDRSMEGRAMDLCSSLRFSTRSARTIRSLLAREKRTREFLAQRNPSVLDIHRFCENTAQQLPETLLLSLSRVQTQESFPRQTVARIWEYYCTTYQEHKKNPLVSGSDVAGVLGGGAGPEVGKWLQTIEEARARGEVRTRGEAMDFLRSKIG
ncbi:MAG TPA: hypothetical protein PKW43_12360 [Deltaproteobacteria bacterium]|nr:hypothetical protein [Deltaproteobacteria bacterium]